MITNVYKAFNNSPTDDNHGCTTGTGSERTAIVNAVPLDNIIPLTDTNDCGPNVDLPVVAAKTPETPIHLRGLSNSTAEVSSYSPVSQDASSNCTSPESTTESTAFDIFEPRDQPTPKVEYAGEPSEGLDSPTLQERNRTRFVSLTGGGSDRASVCTMLINGETGNAPSSDLRRRRSSRDLRSLFLMQTGQRMDMQSSDDDHVSVMPYVPSQEKDETIADGALNSILEEINSVHASQIAELKEEHQDALNQLIFNNTGVKTAISGLRHTSSQMQQRLKDVVNAKEIAEQKCQELEEKVTFKDAQIEGLTSALQARQVSFEELVTRYNSERKISAEREQTLAAKEQVIAAKNVEIAAKGRIVVSQNQEIAAKEYANASQNPRAATTEQEIVSKDEKILELEIEIDELSQELSQKKAWSDLEEQGDIIAELQRENQRLRETRSKLVLGCGADAPTEATTLKVTTAERDTLQRRFDAEQMKNHLLGVAVAKSRDEAFFSAFKANIYAAAFEENPDTPCGVTKLLKLRQYQINELKQNSANLADANMQLIEEVKDTKAKLGEAEDQLTSIAGTLKKTETETKFLRDLGNDYKEYAEGIQEVLKKKQLDQGEVGNELIKYDEMVRKNNIVLTTMVQDLKEEKDAIQKSLAASRSCCAHFTKMSSTRADEVSRLEEKCRAQFKETVAIDLENTALYRRIRAKDDELMNFHEEMSNLIETIDKEFASSQPQPVVARLNNNKAEIARLQKDLHEANACIGKHEWNDQQREQDMGAEIEREVMHVEEKRQMRIKLENALAVYDKLEALIADESPSALSLPRRHLASLSPMEKKIRELGEILTSDFNANRYGEDLERMRQMYYQCVDESNQNAAECIRIQNNYDKQMQLSKGLDWVAVELFHRMLWLEGSLRACGVSAEDFVYEEGQVGRAELMEKCDQFLDLREVVAEGEASNSDAEEDREVETEETPQTEQPQNTKDARENVGAIDDSQLPASSVSEPPASNNSQPRVESIPDDEEEWEDVDS